MSLVNKSISSLVAGMSQQPSELRFDGQAEEILNGVLDLATGVYKRKGTSHLAELGDPRPVLADIDGIPRGAAMHVWSRDASEKYLIVLANSGISAFTTAGKPIEVRMGEFPPGYRLPVPDAGSYSASTAVAYLRTVNPRSHFRFANLIDHTFILNRSRTVTASTPEGYTLVEDRCYLSFVFAASGVRYNLDIGGQEVSITATSGSTIEIAAKMAAAINNNPSLPTYRASVLNDSSTVRIMSIQGQILETVNISDSYGNQAFNLIHKTVEKFSDLPGLCDTGFMVKVTGSGLTGVGYWVRYNGRNWVETRDPNIGLSHINENTMPHALSRGSDGKFYFHPVVWNDRKVGDNKTNPMPSFVGRVIQDLFIYRGRLGFLAEENVILSAATDYFNFWRNTATTTLDTDPIDVTSSAAKAVNFRHAVPFNKELLLFSDNGQFVMNATGTLTSHTVSITETTSYACSPNVRPVNMGKTVTFAVSKKDGTSMREYYAMASGSGISTESSDITAHVPRLLPPNVLEVAMSQEDEMLAVLTEEDDKVFIYKSAWEGNEKVQSAWCVWGIGPTNEFNEVGTIKYKTQVISIEFIDSELFILVGRDNELFLEKIVLTNTTHDGILPFEVSLDRRFIVTGGAYDPASDRTSFKLPYIDDRTRGIIVEGTPAAQAERAAPRPTVGMPIPIEVTKQYGHTMWVDGNWSGLTIVWGVPFRFAYIFSRQFLRDQKGVPMTHTKVRMRRFGLRYNRDGEFAVLVFPTNRVRSGTVFKIDTDGLPLYGIEGAQYWHYHYRPTYANSTVASKITEEDYLMIEKPTGHFEFPVMLRADEVTIGITSDSYVPPSFYAAEWEGFMTARSQRVG